MRPGSAKSVGISSGLLVVSTLAVGVRTRTFQKTLHGKRRSRPEVITRFRAT